MKIVLDTNDAPFLEVAIEGQVDYLITGNQKHYPIHLRQDLKVVSPRQFVSLLESNESFGKMIIQIRSMIEG